MGDSELRDSLEFYWVTGNEELKLIIPEFEVKLLSSSFKKKIGDSNSYADCQLILFQKSIYLLDSKHTVVALLNFSFELVFEMLVPGSKEKETENIKAGNFIGLKLEKDDCDCEFIAADPKEYVAWKKQLSLVMIHKNFYSYYDVKRVIGSGATASVVIAENKIDGKEYAVKSLSKAHIYSIENGKAEIENELELMRMVHQQNVMRLFEVFDADSSIKIVLELVTGGQLLDAIKLNPKLTWFQIASIMHQILSGLQELHSKNIMHRDLKPENILMRNKIDIDLVIADFGLATKADQAKYIYLKCGTPGYVAPEVINLKESETHYETKCDIFSAGAIFYRLCVGRPLFNGVTHAEVLQENKSVKFTLSDQSVKELPQCAQDLLAQLLQIDPKKRITASEALKHPFFKETMSNEVKNISPFKGDVEYARRQLKLEKKRNKESMEHSPLKVKPQLITGKTKPVLPEPSINKRGSFISNSALQLHPITATMQQTNSGPSSLRGSMVGNNTKERKSSLVAITEEATKTKKIVNSQIEITKKETITSLKNSSNAAGQRVNAAGRRATYSHHQIINDKPKDPITPNVRLLQQKVPINPQSPKQGQSTNAKIKDPQSPPMGNQQKAQSNPQSPIQGISNKVSNKQMSFTSLSGKK